MLIVSGAPSAAGPVISMTVGDLDGLPEGTSVEDAIAALRYCGGDAEVAAKFVADCADRGTTPAAHASMPEVK